MAKKVAMIGTLELTPEPRGSLGLRDREYVVKDPVEIVVETEDGDLLKSPQEIRERIVRCRHCAMRGPDGFCDLTARFVMSYGFCAWGEEKGNE